MKNKWLSNKEKIKDWFIIQRIRFLNFVKEHKYVSAGVGVFLLTCVVLLVAFAADSDPYENQIEVANVSVTPHLKDNSNEIQEIPSFSTLVYNVKYNLQPKGNNSFEQEIKRNVIIEATLDNTVDAIWVNSEDSALISNEGKTLSIEVSNNAVGNNTDNFKDLYLNVKNVKNGTEIIPTITIKESTDKSNGIIINKKDENGNLVNEQTAKKVIAKSTEISLTPDFTWGLPYKYSEGGTIGRNIPFGVVLGIDKNLEKIDSLQGIYINPTQTFNITLSQTLDSLGKNSKGIELRQNELDESGNIKKEYFGLYNRNQNIFVPKDNMPHFEYDYNQISVFDSGNIKEIKPLMINKDKHVYESVFSPVVSLTGPKHVIISTKEKYVEEGIKINNEYEDLCVGGATDNCTLIVDGPQNGNLQDENKVAGIYKVKYTYTTDKDSDNVDEYVTLYRTVEVIDENIDEVKYIKPGDTYVVPENFSITKDQQQVTQVDTTKEGKYKIVDEAGKIIYLVISEELVATPLGFGGNSEDGSYLYFNEEAGVTPSKTEYFDANGSKVDSIDNLRNYIVRYTYSEKEKFDIAIESNATVENVASDSKNVYQITVTDIKTDGLFYNFKNDTGDYLALGSYYFTAKSPRTEKEGDKDIHVNLLVSTNSENGSPFGGGGSIINSNYSVGTVKNEILVQKIDDEGNNIAIDSNEFAYGEKLILSSEMSYGIDGDDTASEISSLIDLSALSLDLTNNNFDYSVEVFVNGILKEEQSKNVEVQCYQSVDKEICTDYSNAKFIEYKAKNILPGTTVIFKVKSVINTGIDAGDYKLEVTSEYQGIETKNDYDIFITPFKSTTRFFIDDNEQDIIIDGSLKSSSLISIHPYISLPAQIINTYSVGVANADVTINLELPNGVSYSENNNYIKPTKIEGNTLLYVLENVNINEWLDVICVDINYDVTIPSGTDLLFKVTIDTKDDVTGLYDSTSQESRTISRIVTYQNLDIAHGQYVDSSTISKENPFTVTTKVYNNLLTSVKELQIITILPYNDTSNSNYNGYYEISSLGENAYCTVESPNLVEKELTNQNTIKWESCNNYVNENYNGVTAFKYILDEISVSGLESKKDFSYTTTYETFYNDVDDKYVVKTYLIQGSKKISTKESEVYVMSKKITGVVWEEFDSNGIMDLNEEKISGVTLKLYNSETNEQIDENESDEKGVYHLVVPSSGNYYVVAEYNTDKYRVSPKRIDIDDKSLISSFTTDNSSELITNSEETDEFNGNPSCNKYEDEDGIQYIKCCYEDGSCEEFIYDEEEFPEYNEPEYYPIVRTQNIEFTNTTKVVNNVNLGLSLRKNYKVKVNKYITKVITTNNLGISNTKDFGNTILAKLDVKDINNLNIKVIYTIELQNTGYYPGYVYQIKDFIPEGMSFNKDYEENKGWELNEELGYIKNNTLADELIYEGEKRYLTLALDITRKEAGSFVNYAMIDSDDLQILTMGEEEGSEINE